MIYLPKLGAAVFMCKPPLSAVSSIKPTSAARKLTTTYSPKAIAKFFESQNPTTLSSCPSFQNSENITLYVFAQNLINRL
jgi:hypothetical protein